MEPYDILIVDDDENMNFALNETLSRKDYKTDRAFSFLEAKEKIRFFNYPMVITDVRMPDGSGMDLIPEIKSQSPDTRIIVITAFGKVEDAVDAMKKGADDYILKPFSAQEMLNLVEKYFPGVFKSTPVSGFATQDPEVEKILNRARKAALSDAPVLIRGESGTGKEVLAKFIHSCSKRASSPYVAVNCAAIPDNLLESELFGHEKGAFTGAEKFKPGKFELSDKGTLVLDEIGDMPLNLQAKILRVIQEKEIDRLGGKDPVKVNSRIISLTNQDIQQDIKDKKFRDDLYYRLNVVEFNIPPLRERPADIEFLTNHFLNNFNKESGLELSISPEAVKKLKSHNWPGNVRELQNTIQRATIFCDNETILPEEIEFISTAAITAAPSSSSGDIKTVAEMEKELIFNALKKTDDNRTKAAELLGISSRTLRNKLNEYKLADDS